MPIGLTGLRGLTAQDREDWEKKFAAQLEGRSPEEIENAWRNWNFKNKYGDREDYATLSQMSAADKESYWNNDFDRQQSQLIALRDTSNQELRDTMYSALRDKNVMANDATRVYNLEADMALRGLTPQRQEEFRRQSLAYNEALSRYAENYTHSPQMGYRKSEDLKSLAEQISPYYKRYKGTDLLPFREEDWVTMAADYNARAEAYGQEAANMWLQKTMQDTASENQSTAEKWWNGFQNMGASAYAFLVDATAGIVKGNWDYFSGNHQDIEGAGWFVNYLDAIMDNSVTRYADKVLKTGTIFTDDQEYYEKLGISRIPVIQTYNQETGSTDLAGMIFNENFLPDALSQYGFTIGSMFGGKGLATLSGWGFKGVKGATLAANSALTGQRAMQMRNALTWIQKGENLVNKYAIPGIVGTYEGLQEGLNTKMRFLEEGQRQIADMQSEFVDNKFRELVESEYQKRYDEAMKNNKFVPIGGDTQGMKLEKSPDDISRQVLEQLYQEAWDSYDQQYKDAEAQLNYDAAKAGTNTFMINSAINGLVNQTLKASIFSPSTTGAIRQTRLGRLFTPSGNIRVSGNTATAVMPWYKQAWNIAKEPLGEGLEEYTQNLADAAARGGARNNLAHFLDNKYNGDASATVGEVWADDFTAAAVAVGQAAVSKEAFRDAIYGITSSVMGGPHKMSRATAVDNQGNVLRNEDGTVKKTLFGRGLNSAGEVESNMERVARLMPWRSGAVQAWRENKAQVAELEETAQAISDWLENPDNRGKYDGVVGTFSWAREMERAAENNDEFGYRTSAMGKAINDAIMLSKLKGTDYYDSFMESLITSANLESGSKEAQDAIEMMRANIATSEAVADMSDDEILQQLRDNANKMLDLQTSINESSSKLDRMFGNLDDDTRESLIYGELQIKDWQKRHDQISEELAQLMSDAKIDDTVDRSGLSEDQKDIMTQHGSIEKALEERDALEKKLEELKGMIEKSKSRGNLNDQQKAIIQKQEAGIKSIEKLLKGYKALEGIENGENVVLSESEIMALDPVSRAIMLNPKNIKNYSQAQQEVINNLVQKATAQDVEFLSKIEDDAKIQQSAQKYINDYAEVIADPSTFDIYARRAKRDAANDAYKKRYDSLRGIEDYTEFAHAMDQLYTNASFAERNTILRQFNKDEAQAQGINAETNYSRYRAERQQIAEVLKNASRSKEFANMSSNDINMFVHAITYLTEKGINLNDQEAVTNTLSQSDANGNMFEQYVNALNENADDLVKTDFTSVGEVIQTIKDVLGKYHADEAKSTAINNPVAGSDTPSENNNPVIPPTPTPTPTQPATPSRPGIFGTGSAFSSAEESAEALNREQTPIGEQSTEQQTPLSSYAKNSIGEVVQQAEVMYNMLSTEKEQTTKDKAIEVLNGLKDNSFATLDDFLSTVEARANELDASGEGNQEAADLLRNAVVRIRANAENQRLSEERRQQLNQRESIERSPLLGRVMGINPATSNTNSSNMTTVNLQWLRQVATANPEDQNYSPLLSYLERNHVEQFLQSDRIDRSTPVYFISDPQLAAEQAEVYRQRGFNYGAERLPLIPVVESKEGPITIGDKRYQPIGIMSATNARNISGSSRLGIIREKINPNATSPELILGEDGQPIVTRLSANVHAEPIGQSSSNSTIQEAGQEGLTAEERTELNRLTKEDRRKSPIYQRMKEGFLKRLRFNPNKVSKRSGKTYGGLEFDIPTMKNGTSFPADVWVREVHRTTAANSDATIADLLNRNDPSALNANSRVRGYMRELDKALGAFDDESISFEGDNPTEGALGAVKALAETLNNKLSNFIRTRGYSYIVTPTQRETADGKAILELGMTNGTTVVPLGEIHAGTLSESEKLQVLKNLIMEGDHVRMQDSFHAVAQWNVNYNNVEVAGEDISTASEERQKVIKAAQLDVSNVYDDDILETSKPTLSYRITTVSLEAPYTLEGERKTFTTVANSDNASPATPMNDTPMADSQVVTSNGSVVDGDTGTTIQGTANIAKSEIDKISERLAETIQQDAANFHLSEDEAHYEDGSGKKYARVTSIISADAEGERFDSESPWGLPSTNIGTGVDEFVRDFFAGRFTKDDNGQWEVDGHPIGDVYPNATQKSLTNFIAQLEAFRNKLQADGIVILPREVMAHGTLQITDNEGKAHTIDVAGTLDLLGYDKEGNWHIYDMKTVRNPNVDDHKKAKWSRQLSLYKKFLEDTYGIKVKDLTVIPIKVDYPAPGQRTKYTVSEDKHESYNGRAGNQLIINGVQKFEGARPTLMSTIPIEEKSLDIKYEKLSEAEKEVMSEVREVTSQMLQDKAETVDQGSSEVNTTISTTTDSIQVDSSDATSVIDPTTAMPDTEDISGLFSRKRKKKGKPRNTDASHPLNQYVSSSQAWGVFEGQGLNVEETLKNLEQAGITEEKWNQMSDEERQHELDCEGVK